MQRKLKRTGNNEIEQYQNTMYIKTVKRYARDLCKKKKKKKREKKKVLNRFWIMGPNARSLPLGSETIFRDGKGEKPKDLKVGVGDLLWPPGEVQGQLPQ